MAGCGGRSTDLQDRCGFLAMGAHNLIQRRDQRQQMKKARRQVKMSLCTHRVCLDWHLVLMLQVGAHPLLNNLQVKHAQGLNLQVKHAQTLANLRRFRNEDNAQWFLGPHPNEAADMDGKHMHALLPEGRSCVFLAPMGLPDCWVPPEVPGVARILVTSTLPRPPPTSLLTPRLNEVSRPRGALGYGRGKRPASGRPTPRPASCWAAPCQHGCQPKRGPHQLDLRSQDEGAAKAASGLGAFRQARVGNLVTK